MSPDCTRGDAIRIRIIIIRNGAKTISLQTLFGRLNVFALFLIIIIIIIIILITSP